MKILKVYDEYLQFFKWRWKNEQICCIFGLAQLLVTCAALGQHIYSLIRYDRVLKCEFNSSLRSIEPYLTTDIIVYDFDQCIANHLDGGYGRFVWCINYVAVVLVMLLIKFFVKRPKSFMLWPMLTLQSVYAIGLLILTISSLPKFLPSVFEQLGRDSLGAMLIYLIGATMNFFFTYVLWHFYWFLEEREKNDAHMLIVTATSPISTTNANTTTGTLTTVVTPMITTTV